MSGPNMPVSISDRDITGAAAEGLFFRCSTAIAATPVDGSIAVSHSYLSVTLCEVKTDSNSALSGSGIYTVTLSLNQVCPS